MRVLPEFREVFCRSGIKCYTFPTAQFLHDGKMNVSFRKGLGMQNGTRPAKCLLQSSPTDPNRLMRKTPHDKSIKQSQQQQQ